MKAQQAPPALQARPVWPCQVASTSAQRTTDGMIIASRYSAAMVRIVLGMLLNRFARSQASGPAVTGRGRSTGIGSSCEMSTSVMAYVDVLSVTPAKAGVQRNRLSSGALDSRLRGNDAECSDVDCDMTSAPPAPRRG